jgi:segregation and condensation protein B
MMEDNNQDELELIESFAQEEELGSSIDELDIADEDSESSEIVIHDADREDSLEAGNLNESEQQEERLVASSDDVPLPSVRNMAEMMAIIEALIFVSDEPLSAKVIAEVLNEDKGWVSMALEELSKELNERNSGLLLREIAGGWQLSTRPEHHEHIRAFLRSRPSAKLSLPALETLAVIAYKQPVTVPEILEIRGVQSSSAIKTLLDKRLIVAKGRKETVGRPMMYGTSKEFLLQFGLKDLSELPSIEDFEDLAGTPA